MSVIVVFSTFPTPDKAAEVARTLVEERLIACVNLVGPIRSIYRWKGETCDDTETLAILKTTSERFEATFGFGLPGWRDVLARCVGSPVEPNAA